VGSRIGKAGGLYAQHCASISSISVECTVALPVWSYWLKDWTFPNWNSVLSVVQLVKLHPWTPTWCLRLKTVTCLPLATESLHLRQRGFTGKVTPATERLHWWVFTCDGEASLVRLHLRRRGFTGDREASLTTDFRLKFGSWRLEFLVVSLEYMAQRMRIVSYFNDVQKCQDILASVMDDWLGREQRWNVTGRGKQNYWG
jgi:hypothetical protein